MYRCAVPLLEKKPKNIILRLGTNDAPYKSGTDIVKDLIELKDFFRDKLPRCKKLTLLLSTVHTDKNDAEKNN